MDTADHAALLAPDAWDTLRNEGVRIAADDVFFGVADDPRWDAARLEPGPWMARMPADSDRWQMRVEAGGRLAGGQVGDRALLTVAPAAEAYLWNGPLALHLAPSVGVDVAPTQPVIDVVGSAGIRTPGFYARIGREPLHQGPAAFGLLARTSAPALPGFAAGGEFRLPKKADALGRFGLSLAGGWLPGARSDVEHPLWLLLDARWAPVPWFEAGLARNAVFGGEEDGVPRPIDWGQVILPTRPHAEDDPDQSGADTDERAAWDVRITPPVGEWGVPYVDYVEVFVQHGGEDVIARDLGPVPWPTLGGSANVYGARVGGQGAYVGVEAAVIEDDLYRWYVGHRVYHDGWTLNGAVLGHPWGGDQRSTVVRAGFVGDAAPGSFSGEGRYVHVQRVLVADRVDDTVFVFPDAEVRDEVGLHGAYWLAGGGAIELDAAGSPVRGADFFPENAFAWRIGAAARVRLR